MTIGKVVLIVALAQFLMAWTTRLASGTKKGIPSGILGAGYVSMIIGIGLRCFDK